MLYNDPMDRNQERELELSILSGQHVPFLQAISECFRIGSGKMIDVYLVRASA